MLRWRMHHHEANQFLTTRSQASRHANLFHGTQVITLPGTRTCRICTAHTTSGRYSRMSDDNAYRKVGDMLKRTRETLGSPMSTVLLGSPSCKTVRTSIPADCRREYIPDTQPVVERISHGYQHGYDPFNYKSRDKSTRASEYLHFV